MPLAIGANRPQRSIGGTAATLIGVQALYLPDLLVEIEAIAEI